MRELIAGHEVDIQDSGAPRGERNYWQVLLNGQEIYGGYNGAQAERTYRALSEGLKRATQPAAGEPEQKTAINTDDLPTKKYPLDAFDFDSPVAAPVAAGEPKPISYIHERWKDNLEGVYHFTTLVRDKHKGWETPVFLAPPAAAHGDGRSDADYAIEHGRYLASAADRFIQALNDAFDPETEETDLRDESISEARNRLASSVYEFRKRADRAMRAQGDGGEV